MEVDGLIAEKRVEGEEVKALGLEGSGGGHGCKGRRILRHREGGPVMKGGGMSAWELE